MANERAPAKAPLQTIDPNEDSTRRREPEPDSDDDIATLISSKGFSSIKAPARAALGDRQAGPSSSSSSSSAAGHPNVGHPKMMSSLKQKAGVFIHQKSRPEHHLDGGGSRVAGPRPPAYQDRKKPPLPVFDSNDPWTAMPAKAHHGEEVFYTDPDKASEDLKALLEGGMEEDEEEGGGEQNKDGESKDAAQDAKDGMVDGLKIRLLPHQVEGVEWMRGRELGPVKRGRVPKGGILADDMGLGKTLQTLSLMLTNKKPQKGDAGWKKHFDGMEKTTLVVAPLALIRQWEHEIKDKVAKKHGLKVLVHHGAQRTKNFKDLALYDVVITTYQILVSEHGASSDAPNGVKAGCLGLHWWRVVLDEAHTIKNRNAKATKACYALRSEYRWCLSGTPLQNNLDELQSLVKFLRIKPYDDLREWKEHIDKPMKNGKGHIAIRRLHSILRCFMKRRTKDILKEDGALNPGGKPSAEGQTSGSGLKVTERKVVAISTELSPAERKFYDRLEARADHHLEAMMQEKLSYANAFTLLLRLRQVCNHPKLVEGKLHKDKDTLPGGSLSSQPSQTARADVDAMVDLLAGMRIDSRSCGICGRTLSSEDKRDGENCAECAEDLAYFNSQETSERKKPKRKATVRKVTKQKVKAEPKKDARRARNRNAVVDSDDEEEEAEGSWLVPENERGALRLGKAGGQADEDAEGGGDWIGNEDSDDGEGDGNDKDLSGFVVEDEAAKKEPGYKSADDASDDDDSLLSVSAITKKMASQTLEDKQPVASQASASEAESDEGSASEESDLSVDESEMYASDDGDSDIPQYRSGPSVLASSKIRELLKLLKAETGAHKFIVFSEFTSMLDLVEPFLRKARLRFTRYDGSMRNDDREESLRRLREDGATRLLLCSLKCGSLGLNLTAATRVVILEPFWNPFVEEQAIDRVHRLTQTVDVVIYKLTVKATVEERILALQDKKRELAAQALEAGSKKAGLKLGLSEIIDLFKPGGHHDDAPPPPPQPQQQGFAREGSAEAHQRSSGALLGGRKPGVRRQESEVYGRRW